MKTAILTNTKDSQREVILVSSCGGFMASFDGKKSLGGDCAKVILESGVCGGSLYWLPVRHYDDNARLYTQYLAEDTELNCVTGGLISRLDMAKYDEVEYHSLIDVYEFDLDITEPCLEQIAEDSDAGQHTIIHGLFAHMVTGGIDDMHDSTTAYEFIECGTILEGLIADTNKLMGRNDA